MTEQKIKNLWKWFFANEEKIRNCIENESASEQDYISEQLNNLILDMGVFSWEIGPGNSKDWSLIISPNGDKNLLRKSRGIIEKAPELDKWEFHYNRPARDWDRKFVIYDGYMDEQEINASDWNYVCKKAKNGKTELIFEGSNIKHLDKETALIAANMVIVNEIGEETKINKIASVDIVHKLEIEHDSEKSHILNLRQQFNEGKQH